MANTRRYRLELPAPPNTTDPARIQKYLADIRRLSMDEFNRLAGDFYDFRQEVIDSSTVPLASVAAITVDEDQYSATFTWENPAQTQGVPTHVRVRIAEFGDSWAEYTYPINTWTAFGLSPSTAYTFQIQLVRRAAGTVSFVSALRNCPSIPVQVESLSEIRTRSFTTDSGIGVPTDSGGGVSVIPIPTTVGTPGTPGSANCWWEWQIQIVNLSTGEWSDTVYSGSVAGSADITFDVSTLDPLRLYRFKIREVCNGVPGPWQYGPPFTGGSDWLANCGGNDPSASILVTPYSTADLFAIPYLCFTAGNSSRIREYLSGIEIVPQFAYDLTFLDAFGEWTMLADRWTNSATTKPIGSTVLPLLMDLDNSDDFSLSIEVWVIELPTATLTPGGFGGGTILDIGNGRITIGLSYDAANGLYGVGFTAQREVGGNLNLFSAIQYPIGFTNSPVLIQVSCDNDGTKSLVVNGISIASDTTNQEIRLDGMNGQIQLSAFSNMFVRKVYGWNSAILIDDPFGAIVDDFNRPGPGLGANWAIPFWTGVTPVGSPQITANQFDGGGYNSDIGDSAYYLPSAGMTDMATGFKVFPATIIHVNSTVEVNARWVDHNNKYLLQVTATTIQLQKRVAVSFTNLSAAVAHGQTSPFYVRLRIIGTTLYGEIWNGLAWVTYVTATDSTFASGYAAVLLHSGGPGTDDVRVDDFILWDFS